MVVRTATPALARRIRSAPAVTGDLGTDAALLRDYLVPVDAFLAELPVPAERDPAQRDEVDALLRASRRLRAEFVAAHAERIADDTADLDRAGAYLAELGFAVADRYPGLVPDRAAIDRERLVRQCDKDGREIDQGILFWGLLRSPRAGARLLRRMLEPTPRAVAELPAFGRGGHVDLGTVTVERRDGVGHVTLCRTQCLNAEDNDLVADLETAVDLVLLDDEVRVGVLRGAPMSHPRYLGRRVFCAGIDLTRLYHGQISFLDFLLRRELGPVNKIVRGLRPVDRIGPGWGQVKPWLAAVDAFAIGGGLQLLLAMDHVVAESDARFSLPAAREGIVPGAANLRLGRLVGGRLARQLLLRGRTLHASEPAAGLLCDRVVPEDQLDAAVVSGVATLDQPAIVSNRSMLGLAEEPVDRLREYLAAFSWEQVHRLYSPDVLAALEQAWMGRSAR